MVVTGSVSQTGTLAVQPTATTALVMQSAAITLEGDVYDPPIGYSIAACAVEMGQDGNQLSGTLCGRQFGVGL